MLRYWEIKNKPNLLRSFTGLSVQAFEQLLSAFEQTYGEWWEEQERKREKKRQRQPGGGRTPTLHSGADQLLFILFYFRQYPTQEVQGYLFGISQGQANVWIHRLTPVLNAALGYEMQLPARKAADVGEVLAACPELEFIIDATERPIARPKDRERQRECYSGKKKRHTRKNTIITEKRTGKIKVLGPTEPGRRNDKKMADEEDWSYPPGSTLWKDKGYQGYEPEGVETRQPKKKPRGKELSEEEKEENKRISGERIRVEHSIGGAKVYRVVRDIFRNRKGDFVDSVMVAACGLHNLRLDFPLGT